MTTLRWRGLISSLVWLPFFINAFVGSLIGAKVRDSGSNGWRWGYGMCVTSVTSLANLPADPAPPLFLGGRFARFAIIIPVTTAPIILTLVYGQIRARKLGLLATDYNGGKRQANVQQRQPIAQRILNFTIDVDLLGLILFGFGWSLILIPLTLTRSLGKQFSDGDIIAMLTLGPLILVSLSGSCREGPKTLCPRPADGLCRLREVQGPYAAVPV